MIALPDSELFYLRRDRLWPYPILRVVAPTKAAVCRPACVRDGRCACERVCTVTLYARGGARPARAPGAEPVSRVPAGCAYQGARHAGRHPADRRPRVSRAQDARKKRYRVNLPLARPRGARALQSAGACGLAHKSTHAHTTFGCCCILLPCSPAIDAARYLVGCRRIEYLLRKGKKQLDRSSRSPRPPALVPGPETRDAQWRRRAQRASLCLEASFGVVHAPRCADVLPRPQRLRRPETDVSRRERREWEQSGRAAKSESDARVQVQVKWKRAQCVRGSYKCLSRMVALSRIRPANVQGVSRVDAGPASDGKAGAR